MYFFRVSAGFKNFRGVLGGFRGVLRGILWGPMGFSVSLQKGFKGCLVLFKKDFSRYQGRFRWFITTQKDSGSFERVSGVFQRDSGGVRRRVLRQLQGFSGVLQGVSRGFRGFAEKFQVVLGAFQKVSGRFRRFQGVSEAF